MHQPKCLDPNPIMGSSYLSPSLHQSCKQYRNMNLLSIDYAFQPRLRSRLTQGRRTLPWKPWSIGGKDSHLPYVTHTGILTSKRSNTPYGISSTLLRTLPYPIINYCHSFGNMLSPGKFSAQGHSTSELLRTL